MKLLDIYKEKNKDNKWFEKYFSLARGNSGRLFEYTNTNFRKQDSFCSQFEKFEKIEDKERDEWGVVESSGQEEDKQRVVNMLASKLFMRELKGERKDKNFIYHKTEKGKIYRQFLNERFLESEKWFLNYIFLLNGYYTNEERYIINRSDLIYRKMSSVVTDEEKLIKKIVEVIGFSDDKYELIKKDFFYLSSFYDDTEFLEIYFHSNESEKKELHEYIKENLHKENDLCCISKKYKNGGNFNAGMFLDESKVFYFSILLGKIKNGDINLVVKGLLDKYNFLYKKLDIEKINNFINKTQVKNVIYVIFYDVLGIQEDLEEKDSPEIDNIEHEEIGPQDYIDDTTIDGRRTTKQLFALKKKRAKEISNYKCSLEKLNNCRYFTSKSTNKPYLEVHHVIPQEFRNGFSNSIEVFANYAVLCPYCHEMLHKAVDNERKPLINYLYNERANKLEIMGIGIELNLLYELYNID